MPHCRCLTLTVEKNINEYSNMEEDTMIEVEIPHGLGLVTLVILTRVDVDLLYI